MSYSRSIPNQILHYTASTANYPSHAFRVGNFALSDAGNQPVGAWGEFLGGLNPYAFQSNEATRILDFENQTYTVYIQKNSSGNCAGPACYLIGTEKITPNPGDTYPQGITSNKPWYHLMKFTQYIVGSVSGGITSQIGYYGENLSTTLASSINEVRTAFKWYMDQSSTGDQNNYVGGTYGNRVVVNKFYPPLEFEYYNKVIDTSYTPCCIPVNSTTWYLKDLVGTYTSSVCLYNYEWDYEGGHIYRLCNDPGFTFSTHTGFDLSATNWSMELYVNPRSLHNDSLGFFVACGPDPTQSPFFGFGGRDGGVNPDEFFVNLNGTIYVITGITPESSRWYWFTLKKIGSNNELEIYVNGKYVYTVDLSVHNPFTGLANQPIKLLTGDNSSSVLALQFFGFESGTLTPDEIKSRFLKYALNTKIKISSISIDHKLKLALDTGTKASHQGTSQWIDISGNELHGATASFSWQGYKPAYTRKNFQITHASALVNLFVNPFTISMWVKFDQQIDSNIFKKGRNQLSMLISGSVQAEFGDGSDTRTYTTSVLTTNKWYNITITGTNPNLVDIFIFSHTGSSQDTLPSISPAGSLINVTVDDTSDIIIGDSGQNVYVASVVYWNTRFSQDLANDYFAIQKGRFGKDSNEFRIADIGVCS